MTINKLLKSSLLQLSQEVAEKVIQFKNDGHEGVEIIEYEYQPVKDVEYQSPNFVQFYMDMDNYQRYHSYQWSVDAISDFIEKIKSECPSYSLVLSRLIKFLQPHSVLDNDELFNDMLERGQFRQFIQFLMHKCIQNSYKAKDLEYYCSVYLNDITKDAPLTYTATMPVVNLGIQEEEIELLPDLIIRRPKVDDFAEWTSDFQGSKHPFLSGRSTDQASVLVAQLTLPNNLGGIGDKAQELLTKKLNNALDVLRLIVAANFYESGINFHCESILHGSMFPVESEKPFSNYHRQGFYPIDSGAIYHELKEEEVRLFGNLFNNIEEKLNSIDDESRILGHSHEITYHRYRDTLLSSTLNMERTIKCMVVVQAALMRESEGFKRGASAKLATRFAKLLEYSIGIDFVKVREQIKTAYEIRSKYVHGGLPTEKQIEFSQRKTHILLNYTRIVVSIVLQLHPKVGKDGLIERLESSQHDKAIREVFKKELQSLVISRARLD